MGLELKRGDQVIFLVDQSGSMATRDCDGLTRYDACRESIKAFVRGAAQYDPDGVSIHFFNQRVELNEDVATPEQVDALIDKHKTGGGTATHLAITAAWNEHKRKHSDATFVVVFTDGAPSDPDALKRNIAAITQSMMSPEEFRILFLTVGQRDAALDKFLTDLDENLRGAKYDIVGVEELAGIDFEQAVADLIGSSTSADEAASAEGYTGKHTNTV